MPVSEPGYKELILSSLGQGPTDPLAGALDVIWEDNADKASGAYLRLQYLCSRRDAVAWMRDNRFQYHQVSEQGVSEALNQVFQNLDAIYKSTVEAITLEEKKRAASRGGAYATIERVQPVAPPSVGPDPSDRAYRGDPLRRTAWDRR
jgi:hypothetical protein